MILVWTNPYTGPMGLLGGEQIRGGCGVVLHLTESIYFHKKIGVDHPIKNMVELMDLKILLYTAL